jgi:hypothetical protein
MTTINNDIYSGINKVYFLTAEAEPVDAGVFDMDYGVDKNKYSSGQFDPSVDFFDDTIYEGRPFLKVCFMHHDLSSIGLKIGPGHIHERYFISTEPNIPITDIFRQTSYGNILIYGTPKSMNPPTLNDNQGQIKLWEVEPYLCKEDIELLINNINAVSIFKKELVDAKVKAHNSTTEAVLQMARAVSAESSNVAFATVIKVILARLQQYQGKLIDMNVEVTQRLQKGMETMEGQLDLGIPWNDVKAYDVKNTIEDIGSTINSMTALKNLNPNPSDNVKEYALNMAIEICGIPFIKEHLGSYNENTQPKHISTFSGLSTEYMKNQLAANIPPQEIEAQMTKFVENLMSKFNINGNDMKKAVEETHQEMLTRNPNHPNYQQIPYANQYNKQLSQQYPQQYSQ